LAHLLQHVRLDAPDPFGSEAALARVYGRGVLRVLESDAFQNIVVGFIVVAIIGTIASAVLLWRARARRGCGRRRSWVAGVGSPWWLVVVRGSERKLVGRNP
jgi:hypothetical protein